ncbi:MAG: hypothetical protein ACI3ZQ_05840 [Candidatus Cryptobacteroides sp.]
MGRTSSAVKDRYNSKAYDDVRLRLYKGHKELLQSRAAGRGESLNAWINRAIMRQLEDEGGTLPEPDKTGPENEE